MSEIELYVTGSNTFVYIENEQPMTDSRTIADKFGKRHSDVLRSIKSLECSAEFTARNFALSDYKDSTGRKNPFYKMTRDGFVFLITGFTGREAAKFKEEFIAAFNTMDAALREQRQSSADQVLLNEETVTALEARVKEMEHQLEQNVTLKLEQQRKLQAAVGRRVIALTKVAECRPELFRQLYRAIYAKFEVFSYRDIRLVDFQEALKFVALWRPNDAILR
ncbi:Rha family transcriptional regulator [Paenibacillus graminis]|uniref:Rha family transcriptional regulator n=1 Tax=Paenibacillus graminis TaxID=189425 RepID=UPI002DB74666|nr:Rha family transcriptional regulator [Paenibacillus graminis]MEC0167413.1 Rha family transcriptional regulator [Paenibacillus graminis]